MSDLTWRYDLTEKLALKFKKCALAHICCCNMNYFVKLWICTLNVIIWRVFPTYFHSKVFLFSASETSDKETSNDDESSTTSKEIDQISTLTQSLATLTSEKSRLEQSFQEDKKKVRAEIKEKNKTIESILVELKEVKEKSRVETEEAKSKLIIERHNRYANQHTYSRVQNSIENFVFST